MLFFCFFFIYFSFSSGQFARADDTDSLAPRSMSDDHEPSPIGHANGNISLLVYRVIWIGDRGAQQLTKNRRGFMK